MPYTCTSCGRYQQGHSADGICPASECQPARLGAAATRTRAEAILKPVVLEARQNERAAVVAWLQAMARGNPHAGHLLTLAESIAAGEHVS